MKLGRNITAATGCCAYTVFSVSHLEWRLHELLKWEHDSHNVMQGVVVELRFFFSPKTITSEPLELVV